jgi:LPXTG-motif cell wall-anchored protein
VPATGTVTGTFTVSSDQAPGTYILAVTDGSNSCEAELEVLGDAIDGGGAPGFTPGTGTGTTGTGTGTLPRTGSSSDVTTYAAVGAGLLAVGGISLLAGRRRRPAQV